MKFAQFIYFVGLIFLVSSLQAKTDKYRCMWREDPTTTMVIGWHQLSGANPMVYCDAIDHKQDALKYTIKKAPDRVVNAKGMNTCFVRLYGLKPNTQYYFIIKDSESTSKRYYFKTAPATAERLAIIAGGDSRNQRSACQSANKMVSKLKAHCVLFGGDMTSLDSPEEWQTWLTDWQLTTASDGRMTPIIVSRGNHEQSNQSLFDLFDFPNPELYGAISFGGNLLRVYTLNSLIAPGGEQKKWLENDLMKNQQINWRIANYHYPMVSATKQKPVQVEQILNWATLFRKYRVQLGIESDAHLAKATFPIRPSKEAGSMDHFIRDDAQGTVYIGEGCWGAPLRAVDNQTSWMRQTGSFNHFNWLWIDKDNIEVRTVKTDNADMVGETDDAFTEPAGISLWHNEEEDDEDRIVIPNKPHPNTNTESKPEIKDSIKSPVIASSEFDILEFSTTLNGPNVEIKWKTSNELSGMSYQLQLSTDGTFFKTVAEVDGKVGGRAVVGNYQYSDDESPLPKGEYAVYRLKYVLPDGQTFYCDPFNDNLDAKLWERFSRIITDASTGNLVKYKYTLEKNSNLFVRVINPMQGVVYKETVPNHPQGEFMKTIPFATLPKGRYLLIVRSNRKVILRQMIINK